MVLNYYLPHTSGLTIFVQRLAEALAAEGVSVTVLASRHDPTFPREEVVNGVRVVRSPVLARVHKGVISPAFLADAAHLSGDVDVVHLHLPLLESAAVAALARVRRRAVVLTYHCDLRLPWSLWSRPILAVMQGVHRLAGRLSDRVVTYTHDYAVHSPFVSRYLHKARTILPPVVIAPPSALAVERLAGQIGPGRPLVGFAGRFAAEKGVEHLIATLPHLSARFPEVRYIFAGEYAQVLGESYYQQLQPVIRRHGERLVFLGNLSQAELAAFYQVIDVLVLPSVNSTESFGLVQVEAMLCGTPVVASDLPGVRQPVRLTGMGEVAPIADPQALASALSRVLEAPARYVRPRREIEALFSLRATVDAYLELYAEVSGRKRAPAMEPGPRAL